MHRNHPPITATALPPNPVWRSYLGGSVLRRFRGLSQSADDHFPEDWLASTVRARNGDNSQGPDEGLSRLMLDGGPVILRDALSKSPADWLGDHAASHPAAPGVLWKLLDASVRLQLQAHPDRAFAARHLHSTAGKTECWYVLDTRGPASVYLGFQRPPAREAWQRMIEEQRIEDMLACFDEIPVQPGDCYVVPAGTPHAIGAGVFMMELQEPTDWVVRCERRNAGLELPPDQCFMGLDLERCLDVFDYRAYSVAEARQRFQQSPRPLHANGGFREEEIIAAPHHEFFRLHRLSGNAAADWAGGELLLLLAVRGEGSLQAGDQPAGRIRAGETWLLPGSAGQWRWTAAAPWEVLLAKLPVGPLNHADTGT